MSFEQKHNTGAIFKNEDKKTDKHPDSTGQALIGGVEYWVSAWWNAEVGKKAHFKLSFTPKEQQAAQDAQDQRNESPNPFGGG